jgi:hypothetical protein
VIETQGPINKPRERNDSGPAAIGQKLHSCLEVYINNRINLKTGRDKSYEAALQVARELGVLSQFCLMDIYHIDFLFTQFSDIESVLTEVPMAINSMGVSRRTTYGDLREDDVLAGTADIIIVLKNGDIVVADWKTGLDDVDHPSENEQLMALSYMAVQFLAARGFYMAIVNPVTKESFVSDRLENAGLLMKELLDIDPSRESAGDHCRYCPLKTDCASFAQMANTEVKKAGFAGWEL